MAALAVLALLRSDRCHGRPVLTRDQVIRVFLLTSVVNMSVACGQAFVPGFPLPAHRDVSGLFHNPVRLALLMTLAAPVALAVSLRPGRIGWLRPLAVAALIGVALLFLQVNERSTHVGVTVALAGAVAAMWLGAGSARRSARLRSRTCGWGWACGRKPIAWRSPWSAIVRWGDWAWAVSTPRYPPITRCTGRRWVVTNTTAS